MDRALLDINNCFSNDINYFQMLIGVFQPIFLHSQHIHLSNFWMLIPALTLNYVEYMLSSRYEMFHKKREDNIRGAFTDDGFATGKYNFISN